MTWRRWPGCSTLPAMTKLPEPRMKLSPAVSSLTPLEAVFLAQAVDKQEAIRLHAPLRTAWSQVTQYLLDTPGGRVRLDRLEHQFGKLLTEVEWALAEEFWNQRPDGWMPDMEAYGASLPASTGGE